MPIINKEQVMNSFKTVDNIPPGDTIKNKRIYKLKHFDKWLKKQGIPEKNLKIAANEIENGLFEAALGGLIYKKRIPFREKVKVAELAPLSLIRPRELLFSFLDLRKIKRTISPLKNK